MKGRFRPGADILRDAYYETACSSKEDPTPTRGGVSSHLNSMAFTWLLLFAVYHNRSTANCCCGIGIVSTTQLIVVDNHVGVVPVPDLDAEQIYAR